MTLSEMLPPRSPLRSALRMPPLTLSSLDPTENVACGVMLAVAWVPMTGLGMSELAK